MFNIESLHLPGGKKMNEPLSWIVASNRKALGVVGALLAATIVVGFVLSRSPVQLKNIREPDDHFKATAAVLCQPKEPTVLVYNRVPKAGSSSMTSLLNKLSSKHDFDLVGWFDMPSHDYEKVREVIQTALKKNRKTVVAQHFHFPELVDGDRVAYINVLRDPVSRCTSQYYYLRYGDRDEKDRQKIIDRYGDLSIDECIQSGNRSCFNCEGWKQSIFFCGRDGGLCKKMSPNMILDKAKATIDAHYTVGVIEDFEGTVGVLERLYPSFFQGGVELLRKVTPQRVTKGIKEYIPPSEESKEIIRGMLYQDIHLYVYVQSQLDQLKRMCLR